MEENKITELVRRNLRITHCPVSTIREFKTYCDADCAGNYAVGLQQLLKTKQMYENLIPLISHVLDEVESIRKQPLPSQTKSRRTFADE